ncbi:hypothetical protein SteCoe_12780 [Stentor coeruleus]|uniref:Uncharacterized protein n=1 Tax=Stentor coeruleus TaxID=5963 RepID=A0A1R2C9Y8_9CILI|nr:hypothetical protein SteCoe_12780 [Stentor coeruleus]
MDKPSEEQGVLIEIPATASGELLYQPENFIRSDIDSSQSKTICVCLKSPGKNPILKKSTSLRQVNIVNSLKERHMLTETKLSNQRMEHKANIIRQLQEVPEINHLSRKIAETKNKSIIEASFTNKKLMKTQQTIYSSKLSQSLQKSSSLKPNLLKSSNFKQNNIIGQFKNYIKLQDRISLEDIIGSPLTSDMFKNNNILNTYTPDTKTQVKKKSIIERSLVWKEKINKKRAEWRKIQDMNLLKECTFKPQLSPKTEFNDTGSMITKHYYDVELRLKTFIKKSESPKASIKYITDVDVFPCEYSQLSPMNYDVKYKLGFNFDEFVARAKPMANYQMINKEVDME